MILVLRRVPWIGTLAAATLLLAGCAPQVPSKSSLNDTARAALDRLIFTFQSGDPEVFFSRFDQEYISNFAEYRFAVERFLINNHQINIDAIFDCALENGPLVSVQFHWNRSYVDQNGALQRDSGRCELIFHRRKGKGLLLIGINGQSPFSGGALTYSAPAPQNSPPPASNSSSQSGGSVPAAVRGDVETGVSQPQNQSGNGLPQVPADIKKGGKSVLPR